MWLSSSAQKHLGTPLASTDGRGRVAAAALLIRFKVSYHRSRCVFLPRGSRARRRRGRVEPIALSAAAMAALVPVLLYRLVVPGRALVRWLGVQDGVAD